MLGEWVVVDQLRALEVVVGLETVEIPAYGGFEFKEREYSASSLYCSGVW